MSKDFWWGVVVAVVLALLLLPGTHFYNKGADKRSAKRAAEVGMRKVMGAGKSGLIGQFLGESMVLTFLALIIAAVFVVLFLPAYLHKMLL